MIKNLRLDPFIIIDNHVVTAAHCIHDKSTQRPRPSDNAIFFIGKNDLHSDSEKGSIKVGAKKFLIHPDWKVAETDFDADIAIVILDQFVRYSEFIRPICLWTGNPDVREIEKEVGTLVGWGEIETVSFS